MNAARRRDSVGRLVDGAAVVCMNARHGYRTWSSAAPSACPRFGRRDRESGGGDSDACCQGRWSQGQRSPRLNPTAAKGRIRTGASSLTVAIGAHSPSRSSNASRVRSSRVDEPEMPDPLPGVDRALAVQVELAGRGREHLAHPVRRQGTVRRVGKVGHVPAAPARQVGHENVLAEMKLGLEDDPPPAGATGVVVEGAADLDAQGRLRERMQHGRPWAGVEHAVDNLGDAMGRGVEHVLVGRSGPRVGIAPPCCRGHRLVTPGSPL